MKTCQSREWREAFQNAKGTWAKELWKTNQYFELLFLSHNILSLISFRAEKCAGVSIPVRALLRDTV